MTKEITRLVDKIMATEAAQHRNLMQKLDYIKFRQKCMYCSIAAVLIVLSSIELILYAFK
jgi:hypothetical protein